MHAYQAPPSQTNSQQDSHIPGMCSFTRKILWFSSERDIRGVSLISRPAYPSLQSPALILCLAAKGRCPQNEHEGMARAREKGARPPPKAAPDRLPIETRFDGMVWDSMNTRNLCGVPNLQLLRLGCALVNFLLLESSILQRCIRA